MARTQIEVNLRFCTDALTQKSKTENKVTVVNELAWDHGLHMGEKGRKKLIPFFCIFPHCGT